jgi:hypothetical protein
MHSSSRIDGRSRVECSTMGAVLELFISEEMSLVGWPAAGEGKTKEIGKGLFLRYREELFSGESTGFGLPVLKTRCRTFFPSLVSARSIDTTRCELAFELDRVEIVHIFGRRMPRFSSWIVEPLLQAYIKVPNRQQSLLKLGAALRSRFHIHGAIVPCANHGRCCVRYEVRDGTLTVNVDASDLTGRGHLIVLNEVSGIPFDRLRVGDRIREGSKIPGWTAVPFGAVLESSLAGCGFSIAAPDEGPASPWRLACGREVAQNLNWAGFALRTDQGRFAYRVKFRRLKET